MKMRTARTVNAASAGRNDGNPSMRSDVKSAEGAARPVTRMIFSSCDGAGLTVKSKRPANIFSIRSGTRFQSHSSCKPRRRVIRFPSPRNTRGEYGHFTDSTFFQPIRHRGPCFG